MNFTKYHKDGILWARESDFRRFSWGRDQQLHEILSEIANSNELILDVASDFSMGFLPVILDYNPSACCYASDYNEQCMKNLSECLREYLPKYNIRVASFDNNNIPLKDNSINYITSIYGMTNSKGNNKEIPIAARCLGQDKAVMEIYRILKPGGSFVTVEQYLDCDFDLLRILEYIHKKGKLFGIYSFDEIRMFMEWVCKDSWKRNFSSAGFHIEMENKYSHKLTVSEFKRLMFRYTCLLGIHKWSDMDIVLHCMSKELYEVINSAPSSNHVQQSRAFQQEWGTVSVLNTINDNYYSKNDLAETLWKNVKNGTVTEYMEELDNLDNIGMNVYSGETVYVLSK